MGQFIHLAKVIINGCTEEIPDGAPIMDACESLGVHFGCRGGQCAECLITILQGEENVEPPNVLEKWMNLDPNQRLACQARIRTGTVIAVRGPVATIRAIAPRTNPPPG